MKVKTDGFQPGQIGWVELDHDGNPVSGVTHDYPAGKPSCRVLVTADQADPVKSVSGAPLSTPINPGPEPFGSDWYDRNRPENTEPPSGPTPILDSLHPASAPIGSADVTMRCAGKYFTASTIINFNGGDEPTVFVSDVEVTTVVKPSLVSAPISVPVKVKNGSASSNSLPFAFTAAKK